MLFAALMIAFSGICFFLTPTLMARIMHTSLIGGELLCIFACTRFYRKVKRVGPMVALPNTQAELSPFKSKFVAFVRGDKSGNDGRRVSEAVAESAPSHWWTGNAARDEFKELGRK
jgi:hypothetical protein